jgi:hypothetical protein
MYQTSGRCSPADRHLLIQFAVIIQPPPPPLPTHVRFVGALFLYFFLCLGQFYIYLHAI